MKKIAMSLATIAFVAMLSVGATGAYFNDSRVISDNTFSTGTVKIGSTSSLPFSVSGLYPGAVKTSNTFAVQYSGTIKGDLYFGFQNQSGGDVLGDELDYRVYKVNADGSFAGWVNASWQHADYPYTHWTNIASGMSQYEWARYKVEIRMDSDAGNDHQDATAYTKIVLYAVQQGGPTVGIPATYVQL